MKSVHNFLLGVAAVASLIGWTACSDDESYYTSVDIPSRWMPTDTLCVALEITPDREPGRPECGVLYDCRLGARHSSTFAFQILALNVELHYVDARGVEFVVQRSTFEMPLTDEYGVWSGGSWGSLIQCEARVGETLQFPYVGAYRLLLTPAYGDSVQLEDLTNVSLVLTRKYE